jgi:hypothetical protein
VLVILSVSARVGEQRHNDATNKTRQSERDGMPHLARTTETTQAEITIYRHTCVWKIIPVRHAGVLGPANKHGTTIPAAVDTSGKWGRR